jgi:hypothetical protein
MPKNYNSVDERLGLFIDRSGGPDACWPWTRSCTHAGYGQVYAHGKNRYAHRLSWENAFGPLPGGAFLCHRCDNPPCCNPNHLFVCTQAENIGDAARKDRVSWGEHRHSARLRAADIPTIRRLVRQGLTHRAVAARFGVARETITKVASGRSWVRVPDHEPLE